MNTKSSEYQIPEYLRDLVFGSYFKAEKYLEGKDSVTRDISIAEELLNKLNISLTHWPSVTVTGSKGKGSTAVMLASILSASGEKVGLITSPELITFNERIRIDGKCVTDPDLEQAAEEIAPIVQSIVSKIESPKYLGPGGVIIALAAKIFLKHKVTAIVVEAGRGGEYDESRLIEADVSMITPIMLKHAAKIGPTVEDIAKTKTYITAPGSTIITSKQSISVEKIIAQIAQKLSSPYLSVGKDIKILNLNSSIDVNICSMMVNGKLYKDLKISLGGSYQVDNAALAILSALKLKEFGAKCTTEGIYKGVSQVRWPGRCQTLKKNPWILLEGAINRNSAKYISQIVKNIPSKKITAVIAIHRSEDLEGVCSEISKFADELLLTEVHITPLRWDMESLLKSASKYFPKVTYVPDVDDAFRFIEKNVKKNEGVLLLGHQSFVGSALKYWDIDTCRLW